MEVNLNVGNSSQITQTGSAQTEVVRTHTDSPIPMSDAELAIKSNQNRAGSKVQTPNDGSVVKGSISDIRGSEVTVKLPDGNEITGKIDNTVGLRIGESQSFKVSISDNQLFLTSLNGGAGQNDKILSDILRAYGMKPTPENMKMLELLIENQLPATEENLKLINQAFKLLGADAAKTLFFLENQIRPTVRDANLLQSFADHKTVLSGQLSSLFDSILEIGESALKNQIVSNLLSYKGGASNFLAAASAVDSTQSVAAASGTFTASESDWQTAALTDSEKSAGAEKLTGMASLLEQAEKAMSGAANKAELNIIKEALIKSYPQNEALINDIADAALTRLKSLTEKIAVLAEGQSLDLKALEDMVKSILTTTDFGELEAAELINRLFPDVSDSELKQRIFTSLNILKDNSQIKDVLLRKFSIKPENLSKEEFNSLIKELTESLDKIKEQHGAARQLSSVMSDIQEIRDSLSFLSHMKNNVFIQIPLMINENQSTGELYVFRDKKKMKKYGTDVSALIALDTVNLGRFETYIVKRGNHVNFQFRLDNDEYEDIVRANIHKLNDAMNAHSLIISGVSYKKNAESFTILDKEPTDDAVDEKPLELSRIIFDKRM